MNKNNYPERDHLLDKAFWLIAQVTPAKAEEVLNLVNDIEKLQSAQGRRKKADFLLRRKPATLQAGYGIGYHSQLLLKYTLQGILGMICHGKKSKAHQKERRTARRPGHCG